jgi:fructose-specific phosphotransferase system IIC component
MSSFFNNITSIPNDVVDYINLQKNLVKLQIIEKSTNILSNVITYIILAVVGTLALMCLTIGGAMAINELFNNGYVGFLIVAGIYILLGVVLYVSRKVFITDKIADTLTNILIKGDSEE